MRSLCPLNKAHPLLRLQGRPRMDPGLSPSPNASPSVPGWGRPPPASAIPASRGPFPPLRTSGFCPSGSRARPAELRPEPPRSQGQFLKINLFSRTRAHAHTHARAHTRTCAHTRAHAASSATPGRCAACENLSCDGPVSSLGTVGLRFVCL